ncbi:MAG: phosphodiester glycosidase family protein [bacterium]
MTPLPSSHWRTRCLFLTLLLGLATMAGLAPLQAASLFDPTTPNNELLRYEAPPPEQFDVTAADWRVLPGLPSVKYTLYQEFMVLAFTGEAAPKVTTTVLVNTDRLVFDVPGTFGAALKKPAAVTFPANRLLTELRARYDSGNLRVVLETTAPLPLQPLAIAPEGWTLFWIGTEYEDRIQKTIAPGISYIRRELVNANGQNRVHLIRMDPGASGFRPLVVTAHDVNKQRANVRTLSDGWGGFIGINGTFFDGGGQPQGLLVRDGAILNKPVMDRPSFAIDSEGRMAIGFLPVIGLCTGLHAQVQFDTINAHYSGDKVVLLTPGHPSRLANEADLAGAWKVTIAADAVQRCGFDALTAAERQQCAILLVPGGMAGQAEFAPGEPVTFDYTMGSQQHRIDLALQAGPMLVLDGQVHVSTQGDFPGDIRRGRAPRSAIGLTADGSLLLIAVDGRSAVSAGATLDELAQYLVDAGAKVAMNLDGGSSTQLVVGGEFVTTHPTGIKPVANALVLVDPQGRYGRRDVAF